MDNSLLKTCWEEVRQNADRPHLPEPFFRDDTPTAYINLKTLDICLNQKFIAECLSQGLSEEDAIKGILEHEVEHYLTFPYDLETLLLSLDALRNEGERAKIIENLFSDIVVNITAITEKRGNHILSLVKATYTDEIMPVIADFIGENVGEKCNNHHPLINELRKIDFCASSRSERIQWLKVFARVIRDYIPQNFCCDYSITDFSPDDIKKAIKRLQRQCQVGSETIKRILDYYSIENSCREFYMGESAKYSLRIEAPKTTRAAGGYPQEHKDWSQDEDVTRIDIFSSLGQILPGLAQCWKEEEFRTYSMPGKHPDALIILDTSDSMKNHEDNSPALIAALVLARQYLALQSSVVPINFSAKTVVGERTTCLEKIADVLIDYQGAGTVLELGKVKSAFELCENPDVHIITDARITDLSRVLTYLRKNAGNRPNLWIIGQPDKKYEGICCHNIAHPQDLLKEVVK